MEPGAPGYHLIYDIWAPSLPSWETLADFLSACAEAVKADVLNIIVEPFPNGGVTGVAILSASHIAVHTWPERGFAALDIFTCARPMEHGPVQAAIDEYFSPTTSVSRQIARGSQPMRAAGSTESVFVELAPDAAEERHYPTDGHLRAIDSRQQRVETFTSPSLGPVLALDGVLQVAQLDAYVYHELIAHPALCAHPTPSVVAIVGGGDGHTVIEVLKHQAVKKVHVLEIDPVVIQVSRELFPGVDAAFSDPRVTVHIGDGMGTLVDLLEPPDVVIGDLTDPVGQAERFVTEEFFNLAHRVLAADGILVNQTSSLHYHPAVVRRCLAAARNTFNSASLLTGAIATYPGAWWTFVVGAKRGDPRQAARTPELDTRLYDPSLHSWYFVPDRIVTSLLGRVA